MNMTSQARRILHLMRSEGSVRLTVNEIEQADVDLALYGNAYWKVTADGGHVRLDPTKVSISVDEFGQVDGYVLPTDDETEANVGDPGQLLLAAMDAADAAYQAQRDFGYAIDVQEKLERQTADHQIVWRRAEAQRNLTAILAEAAWDEYYEAEKRGDRP